MTKATGDFPNDDEYDDIPDVPFFKDIYDEHIPEMSSEREQTTVRDDTMLIRSQTRVGGSKVNNELFGIDDQVMGS